MMLLYNNLLTRLQLIGLLTCGIFLYQCSSQSQNNQDRTFSTNAELIAQGESLFVNHCSTCHSFQQSAIGPALGGVTQEADPAWLFHFIRNAPQMIEQGDPRAVRLYEKYQQYMPPFSALDSLEIEAILAYMHTQEAKTVQQTDSFPHLENPIAQSIEKSGLALVVEQVAQAPASAADPPMARINKLLTLPTSSGARTFIHDLRGTLYELKGENFVPYLDIKAHKTDFIDKPGLATGLGSFAFHPEFEKNGLFYTTHTEPPGTATADFAYHDSLKVTLQWVLSEWKADQPKAERFRGSSRELMRINMISGVHGVQEISFNPRAKKGNEDYGLLYMGTGDGGAALKGYFFLVQSKKHIWGTISRIDPLGNNSKNGQYGIPQSNPFAQDQDPEVLKEIWAYGFRNPHRISWDMGGDNKMLITNIGQRHIESIYLGKAGANYGWAQREGTFLLKKENIDQVYPLPQNDAELDFTYPVAQYDHDEGNAISGGFVYRGKNIPQLQGKYIFGDIVSGRLFYIEADKLKEGQQESIHEIELMAGGQLTDWRSLCGHQRVDLRFGLGANQELYMFTKADGKLWKVSGLTSNLISKAE